MKKKLPSPIKYIITSVIAFLVVGFYALVCFNLSFLGPVQRALNNFSMTDVYYQILQSTGAADTSSLITIVDMTDLPDRAAIASGLQDIVDAGPKAVGIDIVFEGLKPDTLSDEWLREIASTNDFITWSFKLLDYDGPTQQYTDEVHSFFAADIAGKEGYTNMPRDLYEGVKRKTPVGRMLNGRMVTSWVNSVADTYAGAPLMPITVSDININFRPQVFPTLHASEVIANPDLIKDRIVCYGTMKEETDMHYCPLGKIPGVELLAYAVNTVVQHSSVRLLPLWLTLLLSLVIVVLTEWMVVSYCRAVADRVDNDYWRTFMLSAIVVGFIKFLWMAILTYIGFMVFALWHVSVNLGWAFSAIAFLYTAEQFYKVVFEPDHKVHALAQRLMWQTTAQLPAAGTGEAEK